MTQASVCNNELYNIVIDKMNYQYFFISLTAMDAHLDAHLSFIKK